MGRYIFWVYSIYSVWCLVSFVVSLLQRLPCVCCVSLLCCLYDFLACFFLPSASLINMDIHLISHIAEKRRMYDTYGKDGLKEGMGE